MTAETRVCRDCGDEKPIDEFGFKGGPPKGVRRSKVCDVCSSGETPGRKLSPELAAYRRSAKNLGLDPDEVERRLFEHDGLCDICGQPEASGKRLARDHDHVTGKFRGFLCSNCNLMLGNAKDDPYRLMDGASYLLRTASRPKRRRRAPTWFW